MKKIWVIEDEAHIRHLLRAILEKDGHGVELFANGENFLTHLESHLPDLIILDIMIPGIGGLQILKNLQEKEKTKGIPVVLLTAIAQESVVVQGIKLGAKDYIRKPFHPKEFSARIKHFLES